MPQDVAKPLIQQLLGDIPDPNSSIIILSQKQSHTIVLILKKEGGDEEFFLPYIAEAKIIGFWDPLDYVKVKSVTSQLCLHGDNNGVSLSYSSCMYLEHSVRCMAHHGSPGHVSYSL